MAANVSSSQVGGLTAGVVHVLAVIPEVPITVVDSQFPSTTLTLQFSPDATVEQLETQIREILRLRNSVAGTPMAPTMRNLASTSLSTPSAAISSGSKFLRRAQARNEVAACPTPKLSAAG